MALYSCGREFGMYLDKEMQAMPCRITTWEIIKPLTDQVLLCQRLFFEIIKFLEL